MYDLSNLYYIFWNDRKEMKGGGELFKKSIFSNIKLLFYYLFFLIKLEIWLIPIRNPYLNGVNYSFDDL